MRARQLYVQLKSAGYDPEYLMLKERYVLTCEVSGLGLARKHSALKLLPTGIFSKFANRIEPAAFIFTQANSPQEFKVASKRHRVILDCIARKDLEFAAMQRADLHKIYVATEKVYMDHADVILYTSPKLWDHIKSNYDHDTAYNPFSFWPERRSKREKMTLAFGGVHSWIDYSESFYAIGEYFEANPDKRGFFFLGEVNGVTDRHAKGVSRLMGLPNVSVLNSLPFEQLVDVISRSHLFVGLSRLNEERSFATSVRTVHSISMGTPVFHNRGTGFDGVFPNFPGELGAPADLANLS